MIEQGVLIFLLFDSIIHVLNVAPVVEASVQLGYPIGIAHTLGIIELVCLVTYLWPRTAVLGGILLLTGYLGGDIASNVRVGNPLLRPRAIPRVRGAAAVGRTVPPRLAAPNALAGSVDP